jgi:hypothetical protein
VKLVGVPSLPLALFSLPIVRWSSRGSAAGPAEGGQIGDRDSAGSIAQLFAAEAHWSGPFSVRAGKQINEPEDQHPVPEGVAVNGTAVLGKKGDSKP